MKLRCYPCEVQVQVTAQLRGQPTQVGTMAALQILIRVDLTLQFLASKKMVLTQEETYKHAKLETLVPASQSKGGLEMKKDHTPIVVASLGCDRSLSVMDAVQPQLLSSVSLLEFEHHCGHILVASIGVISNSGMIPFRRRTVHVTINDVAKPCSVPVCAIDQEED